MLAVKHEGASGSVLTKRAVKILPDLFLNDAMPDVTSTIFHHHPRADALGLSINLPVHSNRRQDRVNDLYRVSSTATFA